MKNYREGKKANEFKKKECWDKNKKKTQTHQNPTNQPKQNKKKLHKNENQKPKKQNKENSSLIAHILVTACFISHYLSNEMKQETPNQSSLMR